jgi:AcrR family transcriptional regulator
MAATADTVVDTELDEPAAPAEVEQRRPGRPRDPKADEAIMRATMDELCEHGFAGLTVDGVAARAGVGKATIYRRWSSKTRLVVEAAMSVLPVLELPDTGNVRDDLIELLTQSFGAQKPKAYERLMAAVIAEAAADDEVRQVLAEHINARRSNSRAVLERAKARGELPAAADVDLVSDLISGALMYRSLMRGQTLDDTTIAAVVDAALAGVVSSGRRSKPRR